MTTIGLLNELSKKTDVEIEFVLKSLMASKKIDFLRLNNAYVQYLNETKEDQLNKLIEAETCVMSSLIRKKKDNNHIQRCLYLLNQSRRFQMDNLNEKYNYDEAVGKEMSWYEKNREENTPLLY